MALLLFERAFLPRDWPVVQYLLVSLMVIVLIYITVLLRETSASYITCVVFMSVAVSHGMDVNPYLFAFNRILDTLIGIGVSLAVNRAHLPLPRRREILFACALDGGLLGKSGRMTAFTRIRLTQLAERGVLDGADVALREHKTVAIRPLGVLGIHTHFRVVKRRDYVSRGKRAARMARLRLVYHGERGFFAVPWPSP